VPTADEDSPSFGQMFNGKTRVSMGGSKKKQKL
jgi:hypothetical protein